MARLPDVRLELELDEAPSLRHRVEVTGLGAAGLPPDEAGQAAGSPASSTRSPDTDPEVPRSATGTGSVERLSRFTGGYTIRCAFPPQSVREAFVPLHHPPGHAQVDFGEAVVELRGQREKSPSSA